MKIDFLRKMASNRDNKTQRNDAALRRSAADRKAAGPLGKPRYAGNDGEDLEPDEGLTDAEYLASIGFQADDISLLFKVYGEDVGQSIWLVNTNDITPAGLMAIVDTMSRKDYSAAFSLYNLADFVTPVRNYHLSDKNSNPEKPESAKDYLVQKYLLGDTSVERPDLSYKPRVEKKPPNKELSLAAQLREAWTG